MRYCLLETFVFSHSLLLVLTGLPPDETVVWNTREMWLYTQGSQYVGEKIYASGRVPECNQSSYRIAVSSPSWVENSPAKAAELLEEIWGEAIH